MASGLVSGPSLLVAGLTHRPLALYIDAPLERMTVGPVFVQVGGVVRAQQAGQGAGAGAGRRLLAVEPGAPSLAVVRDSMTPAPW
jgi:hypothetical protein